MDDSISEVPAVGSTSTNLLKRVQAGQPDAWGRLVRIYGPLVYGWSRRMGLQAADATDIVQEVFGSVSRGVKDFHRNNSHGENDGGTFRGWLWTITRNKIRDHFRAQPRHPNAVGGTDMQQRFAELPQDEPPSSALSSTNLGNGQPAEVGMVHRALEVIRPDFEDSTWEAFWQMTTAGRTSAEVAADLGMTKSAVRQAKYRVLRRLRMELGTLPE
jgi:RNA polymerase sigma-70 factor (ECF subfamily)